MESSESSLSLKKAELIIPILVSCVIFMEFLDITIINTAVPSIAREFAISSIMLKFSVASYFLSLAIFIPISGWCADKFGTKYMFLVSVFVFVSASFLCGIAHNSLQLTMFRFIQGIGSGFMNPIARIIILRFFPPKERLRVQGSIFTLATLGYVSGPVLGGLITTYLNWHWIFFINIPFGLLVIQIGQKYIPQYINQEVSRFDWLGFIIAALALSIISLGVEMFNHYDIIPKNIVFLSYLIGIVLLGLLIIYSLKVSTPVFNFSLFKIKTFRIGFYICLIASAINSSISFLIPLMYQENFHQSSAKAGLLVSPIALGFICARSITTKLIHKFGFKYILGINLFLITIWIIFLAQITITSPVYFIVIIEFLFGVSLISIISGVGGLNYADIPNNQISNATAIDLTNRQFFASLGINISAFCLTEIANYLSVDMFEVTARCFHYTFYVIALIAFIGWICSLKLNVKDGIHISG